MNNLQTPILTANTVECFELAPHQNEVMYLVCIKYYNPEPTAVFRKELFVHLMDKQYSHSFLDINRY